MENDGFGLGAQRRAIEKNDLSQVKAEVTTFLQSIRSGVFGVHSAADVRANGPADTSPGQRPWIYAPSEEQGLKARLNSAVCQIVPK